MVSRMRATGLRVLCASVALFLGSTAASAHELPKVCKELPPTSDSVEVLIQTALRPVEKSKSISALDADEILRAVSAHLTLPPNLALPVFVGTQYDGTNRVRKVLAWPQFTGRIRFTVLPGGKFRDVAPSVRSMTPEVERALLNAVERAAASRALESMFLPKDGITVDFGLAANEAADSLSLVLRRATFPAYAVDSIIRFLPGNPQPVYPEAVKSANAEGSATFDFVVGETGSIVPGTAVLVEGTYRELDDSIIKVLPKYRFRPAIAKGCPINGWARQKFEFKMGSG